MPIAIDAIWALAQNASAGTSATGFHTGTAGTCIVCCVNAAQSVTQIVDSNGGDIYQLLAAPADSSGNILTLGVCPNSVGGSVNITATFSSNSASMIGAVSFSGIATSAPLDRQVSTQGASAGGNVPSGTFALTTRFPNELLICYAEQFLGTNQTFTKDAAYTVPAGCNNAGGASGKTGIIQYQIVSSTGTYSNTMTSTNSSAPCSNFLISLSDTPVPASSSSYSLSSHLEF